MAETRGFQGILGLGDESVWGTEVIVTERVPFLSETLTGHYDMIPDDALEGEPGRAPDEQGIERAVGGFVANWRYGDAQLLVQEFFGSLTTGTYTLDDTVDTKSLTVAVRKSTDVWTFLGYKASQLEFGGDANGIVQIRAVDGIAQSLLLGSATNTVAALQALTNTDANILFHQTNLQIADIANPLAAGDAVNPSSFTLNLNRNLAPSDVNSQTILEPIGNERRMVTLSFELPRAAADTFMTFHQAHTQIQGRLSFTDGTKTKEFLFPNGRVTSAPASISGAALVPVPVEITWYRNLGSNALTTTYDMSAITEELELNET